MAGRCGSSSANWRRSTGTYEEGKPSPLPPLAIQYADYAVWQRNWMQGEVLEQHLKYWKKQLAGAPTTFEVPADRIRPPIQTYRGTTRRVKVFSRTAEKVERPQPQAKARRYS